MIEEFCFHTDAVSLFNERLYSNIFTDENVVSKKKSIKIGDEKFYGFFLEKGRNSYFALDEQVKNMPFKVLESAEHDYKGEVFTFITKIDPIEIPAEKRIPFRALIDYIPAFKHSNPLHFKLYNIVAKTAYIDRINSRISTDAGFGKDSIVNIIAHLNNSIYNMYGGTFAKLEFALINKLIVLNELGNLKGDDKHNFQEFLLATGAFFNTYTKRTRKGKLTQEQYDVSKLSLLLFYNLPSYYINKNQEYFDQMFTEAVINRFIPFVFEGRITSKFEKVIDVHNIVERNGQTYKDTIATLNYWRANPAREINYKVDDDVVKFGIKFKRYERTFYTILKYVSLYAESQKEFDMLTKELYACYKKYDKLLEGDIK